MRRSSQIGFGASIGLAIFSASFVGSVSSEQNWLTFWPQASAGITGQTAGGLNPSDMYEQADSRGLPNTIRRRDLVNRVFQKLSQGSDAVDPILP